ncbi:response regulator with CheY-like receiver, AAA-type ATPase, and DNA-binding domains [Leptolyngbya sp. PCC 7375]|nr:response regulator with CheY-like receiver, AAA-type ATPase, and DNA-binding domains [Leptolyngbya sp. PCC 7375]
MSENPTYTPRVLLIEESDDLQLVIQQGLKIVAGFHVSMVKPSQTWLTVIRNRAPNIVLVDMSSNEGDLLEQLQNNDLTKHIPLILLVPRNRTQDQFEAKQRGAAEIIAKPFDFLVLAESISRVLGQSRPA